MRAMQSARLKSLAAYGLSLTLGVLGALLVSPHAGAGRATDHGRDAAAAAQVFLASLPEPLRRSARFPLDSPERRTWYFTPHERVGVSLLQLDPSQSDLLGPLLASALSDEGLLKARDVIK